MSRSPAGLTLVFAVIISVALAENLNAPVDPCAKCRTFDILSDKTTREKNLSEKENDLLQYCFRECRYLYSDETVKNFYSEQRKQEDPNRPETFRLESVKRQGPARNTVTVLEATLDLPPGLFGMRRCERLDLAAMGVPPFYIKLMKSIARLLLPKLRGEIPESQLKSDPFMAELDREFLETSKVPRVQRGATQKMMEKN